MCADSTSIMPSLLPGNRQSYLSRTQSQSLSRGLDGEWEGCMLCAPGRVRLCASLGRNRTNATRVILRVSFGSSKGSMVETLVYESPLREEPEAAGSSPDTLNASDADADALAESKRVRVSFFECQRPVQLPPPDVDACVPPECATTAMAAPSPDAVGPAAYQRQSSTDSGWDNPFRPDGNLSREADEIVELIKGGKPITPTSVGAPGGAMSEGSPPAPADATDAATAAVTAATRQTAPQLSAAPGSPAAGSQQKGGAVGANGNAAAAPGSGQKVAPSGGSVEVQRGTVDASQAVEHVVLKKKQKCKCCVLQ